MLPLLPHDPPSVGAYHLHARLGEDTSSRVYLATVPGRLPVALRIVRSKYTDAPGFRSAFARRVEGSAGPRSRYAATVVDADLGAATPWVAVTRPAGPALTELVRAHGPLPAGALHPLALALAQGLADLHAAGAAHGSLRPDGVLLSRDHALLADPGLDSAVADIESRDPRPPFTAPEGGGTAAADVFAWAATLSFAGSGVEGTAGLDRIPLQLRGLVDACLRGDPDLRPNSEDLVRMLGGPAAPAPWPPDVEGVVARSASAMEAAVASTDPSPGRPAQGTTPRAGAKRRRFLPLLAGGAALLLVAGTGAAWWAAGAPAGAPGDTAPDASEPAVAAGCLDGSAYPPPAETGDDMEAMQVAFSPDGDAVAVTSARDGLALWDWRSGRMVARPADDVYALGDPEFAPSGCLVVASTPVEFEGGEQPFGVATTFDIPTGNTQEHLGTQEDLLTSGMADPEFVRTMGFSPNGEDLAVVINPAFENRIANVDDAPNLGLIDLATGDVNAQWDVGSANDVLFLDSARVATIANRTITVWDTETGAELHTVRNASEDRFTVIPGSDEVVYFSGDELVRWDFEERVERATYSVSEFTAAEDAFFTGLSVDAGLGLLHFSWATATDPDINGSGRTDDNRAHLWDLDTGEELLSGADHPLPRPVAFHPGGEAIAAVTHDGDVEFLDPESLDVIGSLD